jgi:hypothetical protein
VVGCLRFRCLRFRCLRPDYLRPACYNVSRLRLGRCLRLVRLGRARVGSACLVVNQPGLHSAAQVRWVCSGVGRCGLSRGRLLRSSTIRISLVRSRAFRGWLAPRWLWLGRLGTDRADEEPGRPG